MLCVCGKPATDVCGGCTTETYCSSECQKEAWVSHKVECKKTISYWDNQLRTKFEDLLTTIKIAPRKENEPKRVRVDLPLDEIGPFVQERVLEPFQRIITYISKMKTGQHVLEALWAGLVNAGESTIAQNLLLNLFNLHTDADKVVLPEGIDVENESSDPDVYLLEFITEESIDEYSMTYVKTVTLDLDFSTNRWKILYANEKAVIPLVALTFSNWMPAIFYFYILETKGRDEREKFLYRLLNSYINGSLTYYRSLPEERVHWVVQNYPEVTIDEFYNKTYFPDVRWHAQRRLFN